MAELKTPYRYRRHDVVRRVVRQHALGVTGIFTDRPELLLRALGR